MGLGQFARRWLPAIVLAIGAFALWNEADRRDVDVVSTDPIDYELRLATPMLSARRVPRTLQAPVVDAKLAPTLRAMISDSPTNTCLLVQVGDREIGPSSRVDAGLVPASNQKLLATYGAYLALGADFQFTTSVVTDAVPVDGVLEGNLYFVGSGDPFLSTDDWWTQFERTDGRAHTRLEELADRIAATGIVQVNGAVVGDESLFDAVRQGPWAERLINDKQSGPLSALTVNEGFNDWPETYVAARLRSEDPDPPVHAASVLTQLLAERGVTVAGAPVAGVAPQGAALVEQISSPPLIELLTHINSYSSNIGAELLLKRLGVELLDDGSTVAGAAALREILAADGVPVDRLVIDDGSGLAESNQLTCRALAAVLANAEPGSDFAATLAIAGERGTLVNRMVDTPGEGSVAAKTGTLNNVTALSGYAASGNDADVELVFAYMANGEYIGVANNEEIIDLQDAFAASLTAYPGSPTVGDLSPLPPTDN
jgi:D-alanyl-D-alanine carboxypeptidase/D-alanyl-D-alanine-endopeptidase (penicillin-binding protein 4)